MTACHLLDRLAALRVAWKHVVEARHAIARQIGDIEDALVRDIRQNGPILHRGRLYTTAGSLGCLNESEVRASVAVLLRDDTTAEGDGE